MGLFSTLEFNIMLFPPKIDMICFQNLGRFGARLENFYTVMSQWRVFSHQLILVLCIFSATFFYDPTRSWRLKQQKPQHARYQNSNLAPLASVGVLPVLGVFQEESVLTCHIYILNMSLLRHLYHLYICVYLMVGVKDNEKVGTHVDIFTTLLS